MMATMYGWRDGVRGRVAAGVWALALVAGVGAGAVTATSAPGVPVEGGGYDQPAGAVELDAAEDPATPAVGTATTTTAAAGDVPAAPVDEQGPAGASPGPVDEAVEGPGRPAAGSPAAPVVADPPEPDPPAATTTTTTAPAPVTTTTASTLPEPPPTTTPCCGLPVID